LLGFAYHLSHRKVRSLLDQVLGVEISTGSIKAIRQENVVYLEETGGPIGNADGNNPEKKRGWLWVMVTPALAGFHRHGGTFRRQCPGGAAAGGVGGTLV
jgi:transposase